MGLHGLAVAIPGHAGERLDQTALWQQKGNMGGTLFDILG